MKQLVLIPILMAVACGSGPGVVTPLAPGSTLGAPGIEGPANSFQVDSTRPQLVIRNSAAGGSGARAYEVQIASTDAFTSIVWSKTVDEQPGVRTIVTVDQDLTPLTPYHWRARLVSGGQSSDWSLVAAFRSGSAGFNRPGELWDPLTAGTTVGTTVGPTSFVEGKGIRLETQNSYVRYQLPETVSAGEFSMIVEGISANGPTHKLKIFSMSDGPGDFISSRWEAAAHYRGLTGNPDNAISLKVVWGTEAIILEPDFAVRAASVVNLSASNSYFWQGTWGANFFRLVVRNNDASGSVIYDRTFEAPAVAGLYSPSPHFAYIGANSGAFGSDAGTWPGMIVRNVWLGRGSRPAGQ
jgi:hypothetical protein